MTQSEPKKEVFGARFRVTWPYWAGGYPDQQKALEVYQEHQSSLRADLAKKVSERLGSDSHLTDISHRLFQPVGTELSFTVEGPSSIQIDSFQLGGVVRELGTLVKSFFQAYMPGGPAGANFYVVESEFWTPRGWLQKVESPEGWLQKVESPEAPSQKQDRRSNMSDFELSTIEIRRFESPQIATPFEVEFHQDSSLLESLSKTFGKPLENRTLDAEHILRLVSRIAITGAILPPLSVNHSSGPVLLNSREVLRLGLELSRVERFPTKKDYERASAYLAVRQLVAEALQLKSIELEIREGERREEEERRIEAFRETLAGYYVAYSMSPELGFSTFVELLRKNKGVFSFPASGNLLLGASALGAAYQIAILANPIVAIQLAAGGAVAYAVLRFGAAAGQRIHRLFQ